MAFRTSTLAIIAFASATALAAVGCSDSTDTTTGGDGGSGNTGNQGGSTGGSNTGGSNTGGSNTGGSGGGAVEATCAAYCTANIATCSGGDLQWGFGMDAAAMQTGCENFCTVWDQGEIGATTGDSLECRMYHTGAAASDAGTHCSHAGPYGNTQCGDTQCDTYCDAILLLCTGGDEQFSTRTECMTDCGALTDSDDAFDGTTTSGDTFACRGYHLNAAAVDAGTHCEHASGAAQPCQ